ncbi:MAG TPA: MBL fold metallo-hydrolase [Actinomycetota bacterium]|nr:MBL fold metallo-hydrolase [Actinomycetota bacterium]
MLVAEGIHRLTRGIVNVYLVEDGGRLTVVDAGAPRDWDLLVSLVGSIGRSLDDLEAILLTHAHSDHTGFAERARSEAGATIRVHAADVERATTGATPKNEAGYGRYLLRPEAYRTLFGLMRSGGLKIVPIAEVTAFDDGETLGVPGGPRVVHAPGHTQGSCALLFESRRALVTGDVLTMRNPLTGRTGPQIGPDGLNQDSEQAMRSLGRLASVPADVLLPGHGDPWTHGVAEAVRLARAAGRS